MIGAPMIGARGIFRPDDRCQRHLSRDQRCPRGWFRLLVGFVPGVGPWGWFQRLMGFVLAALEAATSIRREGAPIRTDGRAKRRFVVKVVPSGQAMPTAWG
jgi:hypothetical protein